MKNLKEFVVLLVIMTFLAIAVIFALAITRDDKPSPPSASPLVVSNGWEVASHNSNGNSLAPGVTYERWRDSDGGFKTFTWHTINFGNAWPATDSNWFNIRWDTCHADPQEQWSMPSIRTGTEPILQKHTNQPTGIIYWIITWDDGFRSHNTSGVTK